MASGFKSKDTTRNVPLRMITWTLLFALWYIQCSSAATFTAELKVMSYSLCTRDDTRAYTCKSGQGIYLECKLSGRSCPKQIVKKASGAGQDKVIPFNSHLSRDLAFIDFDLCADPGRYVCKGTDDKGVTAESQPIILQSAGGVPAVGATIGRGGEPLTTPWCPWVAPSTWLCGGDSTVKIGCDYPCVYNDTRYRKRIAKKSTGSGPDKVVTSTNVWSGVEEGSGHLYFEGQFIFDAAGDEDDVRGPGQYVCQVTDTKTGVTGESKPVSLVNTNATRCGLGCSGKGRCVRGYNYILPGTSTALTLSDRCYCNYPYSGPDCQYRKCHVYTDPQYTTFDGLWMPFQDQCNFIMAQDKNAEHFKVVTYHEGEGVSFVRRLTITIGSGATPPFVVQLLQDRRIKVKKGAGSFIDITGFYNQTTEGGFDLKIENVQGRGSHVGWVVLTSERAGLQVDWNGNSAANVFVSEDTYKGKMEGLCGNFDDDKTNDLTPRGGPTYTTHITGREHYGSHRDDYDKFGRSWNTTGSCQKSRRKRAAASTNKCEADAALQTSVEDSCKFEEFRDFADPATLQAACVLDQCHGCGDYCRSELKAVIARNVALQNNTQMLADDSHGSNDAAGGESGDNTAIIIGAVVGCLVLIGCGVGVFCWWKGHGGRGRQAAPEGDGAGEEVGAGGVSTADDQPGVSPLSSEQSHESSVDELHFEADSTPAQKESSAGGMQLAD